MLITILTILCGLFAVASIALFLLWQRSEHRWNKHYCDDECYEYGCSEVGLYTPEPRELTDLEKVMRDSYLETFGDKMATMPLTNAKITNLSVASAGLKIPFELKEQ